MNWKMVAWRGVKLPGLLLLTGLMGAVVLGRFSTLLPSAGVYADHAFLAGLAASLLAWITFYLRLIRWERGTWKECQYCGGPLGWLKGGKVYYGKQLDDFRRCYNCGRATPEGNL